MPMDGERKVRCAVRVKPTSEASCVRIISGDSLQILAEGNAPAETCTVEFVYSPEATQSDVYDRLVQPLLRNFVHETLNVALLTFGTNSSGKTHSLVGGHGASAMGIIPRIIHGIFAEIAQSGERTGPTTHDVEATHFELVGENVRDLFAENPDRSDLDVVEDQSKGQTVSNLTAFRTKSADALLENLYRSNEERSSVENGNGDADHVSTFFNVEMQETTLPVGNSPQTTRRCRLMAIELPAADSLAEDAQALRQREGPEKHRAILAFSHLVRQLAANSAETEFANYRGSKLTRLLEDVLGGNCVTVCLATLDPDASKQNQAVATIQHVKMLQNIQNYPLVEDDSLQAILRRHRKKVAQLIEEVEALNSRVGAGGDGGVGSEMGQHLLAIHELEGRVITANMEKVRLGDEREKLMSQFNALRAKYTDLAKAKAELQHQLIASEEDRLKIAETLIDLKMEKAQGSEAVEKEKFELQSQLVAAQNEVVELEMRQKADAAKVKDLEASLQSNNEENAKFKTELVTLKNNLLYARKDTELHKRKTEELSIELLNLVNARDALTQEKDLTALSHAEQLAMSGNEKMSDEDRQKLELMTESVDELTKKNFDLNFQIQQKNVEFGQLELQLKRALDEQISGRRGEADQAEEVVVQLQGEITKLGAELKRRDRLAKEQEADLRREAQRYSEVHTELQMARERLQEGDRKFREQIKEHMEDISRLTSRATPKAEQLNTETRALIDQMAQQIQMSYAERESSMAGDLAAVRERLARAVHKNRLLFNGYRRLRHRIEDAAPRGSTPDVEKETDVEEGELVGEGMIMEEEMAVMRQRINGLEEDLDRQRLKAITATEAYQKMVVDLQQRHAGTVAELEVALNDLEKLQGYKDVYTKLQADSVGKDSVASAAALQENMQLKIEISELKSELRDARHQMDNQSVVAQRAQRSARKLEGGSGMGGAHLSDDQIAEFENMRATHKIVQEENIRLTEELRRAREEVEEERDGGIASARAMAEGRKSFNKGLKEFAATTLANLEAELADWKTRAVVAETEVERLDSYMNSYLPQVSFLFCSCAFLTRCALTLRGCDFQTVTDRNHAIAATAGRSWD